MERLTEAQEADIVAFAAFLGRVANLDDLFPPDMGVRAAFPPSPPSLPPQCMLMGEAALVPAAL